jgi:hypothetical protein
MDPAEGNVNQTIQMPAQDRLMGLNRKLLLLKMSSWQNMSKYMQKETILKFS